MHIYKMHFDIILRAPKAPDTPLATSRYNIMTGWAQSGTQNLAAQQDDHKNTSQPTDAFQK